MLDLLFSEALAADVRGDSIRAQIVLDQHRETVNCDISLWTITDYRSHWELGRSRLRSGQPYTIFCSSLRSAGADLWVAVATGQSVTVFNLVAGREDIVVDNLTIHSSAVDRIVPELLADPGGSKWTVNTL